MSNLAVESKCFHMFGNKLFKLNMAGAQGVFLRTNRGNPKLCFGGYVYTKHRAHDFLVIWRRTRKHYRCRVAATPSGLVVEERMPHGHEANQAREEYSRVRIQMKYSQQPSQLLARYTTPPKHSIELTRLTLVEHLPCSV